MYAGRIFLLLLASLLPSVLALGPTTRRPSPASLQGQTLHGTVSPRGVFCTRSLDMEAIKCIGYDMDYTLIDYQMEVWEERAYHYSKEHLRSKGFPVSGLSFNPELVCRGIIIDKELGNFLKVDRFGYVRRAMHGTHPLTHEEMRAKYKRLTVDLRERRWSFLNTLFSVSEGCLYAQLVDRLDSGQLLAESKPPFDEMRCSTYAQLFQAVSKSLYRAHVASKLKEEVMADPLRFVRIDPATAEALLDQRDAGKKLALVTNSDWVYTCKMMTNVFGPYVPAESTWRDLFDLVIVSACKPEFFGVERRPVYEIATADGMLRETHQFVSGGAYAGGNAKMFEKAFGISGDEVLYVGDHIYSDVNMAKRGLSWRTCLIMQELETEIEALAKGQQLHRRISSILRRRSVLLSSLNEQRRELARRKSNRLPHTGDRSLPPAPRILSEVEADVQQLYRNVEECTNELQPLLAAEGAHVSPVWGYMSRAGYADKSHLMRQIEKYADVYTSRVSNFVPYSPYAVFTSPRHTLSHDMGFTNTDELSFEDDVMSL